MHLSRPYPVCISVTLHIVAAIGSWPLFVTRQPVRTRPRGQGTLPGPHASLQRYLYYTSYFCSLKARTSPTLPCTPTTNARSNTLLKRRGGHAVGVSPLGPSIHLAFEEFEPGHLALRLPIAVRQLEGRTHGGILLEARREAFQVWQPTRQDRLDPGLQLTGQSAGAPSGERLR